MCVCVCIHTYTLKWNMIGSKDSKEAEYFFLYISLRLSTSVLVLFFGNFRLILFIELSFLRKIPQLSYP